MVQTLRRSKSFRILFNSPELVEEQRSSFHHFLKHGIAEELAKISCIKVVTPYDYDVEVFFDATTFQLVAPDDTSRDCILKMKTYACKLYVQTKIVWKSSEGILTETEPKWVLLAHLPMMTKRGHFVINGSPRVIVHQVVRAPGIYFQRFRKVKTNQSNKARFYGDIIPRKGAWVRLQISKKGHVEIKLKEESTKVEASLVERCLAVIEKQELSKSTGVQPGDSSSTWERLFALGGLGKPKDQDHRSKKPPLQSKTNGFCYDSPKPEQTACYSSSLDSSLNLNLAVASVKLSLADLGREKVNRNFRPRSQHTAITGISKAAENSCTEKKLQESLEKTVGDDYSKHSDFGTHHFQTRTFVIRLPWRIRTPGVSFPFSIADEYGLRFPGVNHFSLHNLSPTRSEGTRSVGERAPRELGQRQRRGKALTDKFLRAELEGDNSDFTNLYTTFYQTPEMLEDEISMYPRWWWYPMDTKHLDKRTELQRTYAYDRLFATFKAPWRYDLGEVGRKKLNNKFGFSITDTQLTSRDIEAAQNWLYRLRAGKEIIDDIDHSQNRRVRQSGELIQSQFANGVTRLRKLVRRKFSKPTLKFFLLGKGKSKIKIKKSRARTKDAGDQVFGLKGTRSEGKGSPAKTPEVLKTSESFSRSPFLTKQILKKLPTLRVSLEKSGLRSSSASSSALSAPEPPVREVESLSAGLGSRLNLWEIYESLCFRAVDEPLSDPLSEWDLSMNPTLKSCDVNSKRTPFNSFLPHFKGEVFDFKNNTGRTQKLRGSLSKQKTRSERVPLTMVNKFKELELFKTYSKRGAPRSLLPLRSLSNASRGSFEKNDKRSERTPKDLEVFSKGSFKLGLRFCQGLGSVCRLFPTDLLDAKRKRRSSLKIKIKRESARKCFDVRFYRVELLLLKLKQKQKRLHILKELEPLKRQEREVFDKTWGCRVRPQAYDIFSTKPINGALREFFGSNPLSQYMDQTNPLAELTHKRRISSLGIGGVSRESAGMAIRGIHPTQYGRICPIETPEGKNAGLVNSLALYARINNHGFIETPYYKVIKGQVQEELGFYFYSARKETVDCLHLAPSDLQQSQANMLGTLPGSVLKEAFKAKATKSKDKVNSGCLVPVRVADTLLDGFKKVTPYQVDCIGISPVQILSVATALIPFLEHNDANRALMGSNMQRQAVPLMIPERPIVGTGLETLIAAESGQLIQSSQSGIVSHVSANKIIIERLVNTAKSLPDSNSNSRYPPYKSLCDFTYRPLTNKVRETSVTGESFEAACSTSAKRGSRAFLNVLLFSFPKRNLVSRFAFSLEKKRIRSSSVNAQGKGKREGKDLASLSRLTGRGRAPEIFICKEFGAVGNNPSRFLSFEKLRGNLRTYKLFAKAKLRKLNYLTSVQLHLQLNESLLGKTSGWTTPQGSLHREGNKEIFSAHPTQLSLSRSRRPTAKTTPTRDRTAEQTFGFTETASKEFLLLYASASASASSRRKEAYKSLKKVRVEVNREVKLNTYPPFSREAFEKKHVHNLLRSSSKSAGTPFPRGKSDASAARISCLSSRKVKTQARVLRLSKFMGLRPFVHSLRAFSRSNQETCLTQKPLVQEGEWVQKGAILTDCSASEKGELAVGKNVLIAYLPWEGYNFEDAIVVSDRLTKEQIYASLHIERYICEAQDVTEKLTTSYEWFTPKLPGVHPKSVRHLDHFGLPKIGTILKEGDILIGRISYFTRKPTTPEEKLISDILGDGHFSVRLTSPRVPKGVHEARVIRHRVMKSFTSPLETTFPGVTRPLGAPKVVHIFLGEKRSIEIGDKMSGRHGNKGIISTILPKQDMPYLPDGTPIDILLNPLGVPSRMNVGQIFESLLGLASTYLNQNFKITAFDEVYGVEASQSLVYLKLYQARLQSGQNWLFQINFPGKTRLVDGRSGECFDQWVTVGRAYMLKLIHMVNEKIHARSTGPYALVTQQPLRGRSHKGGQRLGEMEVWALEGYGAAYTLQELLTKKSDDFAGRRELIDSLYPDEFVDVDFLNLPFRKSKPGDLKLLFEDPEKIQLRSTKPDLWEIERNDTRLGHPEIFKTLICELQALCLDVGMYSLNKESFQREYLGIVN
jgi:DNA-directed RNA polymerase beta subunit